MDFQDFITDYAAPRQREHPRERAGQNLYNVLYETKRHLAHRIMNTDLDPFHLYAGYELMDVLIWLAEHWDDAFDVTTKAGAP